MKDLKYSGNPPENCKLCYLDHRNLRLDQKEQKIASNQNRFPSKSADLRNTLKLS